MTQVITHKKHTISNTNRTDVLLNEMNRRKVACLNKLQKISDRINVIEKFKKDTLGEKVNFKNYLKSKGYDYKVFVSPMGYYTPKGIVVSDDIENDYLTYHNGMKFNKNVGYHIPKREIVGEKEHQEITSSIYGMTWNPALMHYYPTTVFDSQAYASSEGIGDTGMDMIGGLRIEDFANLSNEDENSIELTSMVQVLLEEEFDNVEQELDLIEQSEMQLIGFDSSFEGEEVKSGRNAFCRTNCATKHPFNKAKRTACEKECDKKFKPSQKQENKRDEREDRKEARQEFRSDKKSCKEKLRKGQLTQSQYRECLKKERKDKRSDIKEAGGNVFGRYIRIVAKVSPFTLAGRGGALLLISNNAFGFSTRIAPAILPKEEAEKIFKKESIDKANNRWGRVDKLWRNLGGDVNKLKESIIKGYNKKPMKIDKESSFEGDYYSIEFNEEYSNFSIDPVTGGIVVAGLGVVSSLVSAIAGTDKNPYKQGMTPIEYQNSLNEGDIDNVPPQDPNSPQVNPKTGDWIDPKTGRVIDPITGKYKDTIFGVNKWVAIGIGVVALAGIYYVLKGKK
jgi:hypothetical protein